LLCRSLLVIAHSSQRSGLFWLFERHEGGEIQRRVGLVDETHRKFILKPLRILIIRYSIIPRFVFSTCRVSLPSGINLFNQRPMISRWYLVRTHYKPVWFINESHLWPYPFEGIKLFIAKQYCFGFIIKCIFCV